MTGPGRRVGPATGFSLLEVTLAVAIIAVVAALVAGTLFSQTSVDRTVRQVMDLDQLARVALDRLARDLERLTPLERVEESDPPGVEIEPVRVSSAQGYRLRFPSRVGATEPVVWLVYQLAESDRADQAGLVLTRRETGLLNAVQGQDRVVCRRVASFRVTAVDKKSGEADKWADDKPPTAVRLELELIESPGRTVSYSLTVTPLVGLQFGGQAQ